MSLAIIVCLPMIFGFGLLYWSNSYEEDHILKHFFRLMFLPLMLLSIHLAVIDATILYAANTELISLLSDIVYYIGWFIFIIGAFYFFYILNLVKNIVMEKREQKQKQKYED